ncbi:GGDEF domain-containing protein [Tumidithrix helvetica PCC 7403]|uniref:diguanylate cyclase n=1 Tax=Tumidithrix helvetica TaxID=3457545 RepID=UPI003CC4A6EA
MDEQAIVVRVAWCSPMDLPKSKDLFPDFELYHIDPLILSQSMVISDNENTSNAYNWLRRFKRYIVFEKSPKFDLLVLDIRFFQTLEDLKTIKTHLGLTTVVLVDGVEQESSVLSWLDPEDEICRRDAIEQQIGFRLRRCDWHRQQKYSGTLDSLTGVANRQRFQDYAIALLESNDTEELLCLILLDLDYFKVVNDTFGHSAGDNLLQKIGELLRQYALGSDLVARIGGEEFVVCMRGSLEQGRAFAEFLRTQIEAHEFGTIRVTASFGVASFSGHSSFEELMEEADQCLYAAKGKGRNCVVTASEFDAIADADGQDGLLADFENRIHVAAARMASYMVLKARKLYKQYRAEADRDGLTGVFNRRYLDRLLLRELEKSQKHHRHLTVALLDLDHFGEVNRTYGFPTGDRALKAATKVLQQSVRVVDWVARYGGEEFCIVMPDTELREGCQVAERIRLALEEETVTAYNGQLFQVTASIGVVELIAEDIDPVALLQRASDKVREAKKSGRNQIRF